jgi:hypothetical protein
MIGRHRNSSDYLSPARKGVAGRMRRATGMQSSTTSMEETTK